MEQAQQYRKSLIRYMKNNEGLTTYRLITHVPRETFMTRAQLKRLEVREGTDAVEAAIAAVYDPDKRPQLPVENMPEFSLQERSITTELGRVIPEIGIMLLLNLVLISLCWVLFLRFDIR